MKTKTQNGKRTNGKPAGEVAPRPEAALSQHEARKLQGRALRTNCPRSSHAGVVLGQAARDPLALIVESDQDRVATLLPIRFTRMAESANRSGSQRLAVP